MATGKRRKKALYRRNTQNRFSMFLVSLVVVMILVVVAVKSVEITTKMKENQTRIDQLNGEIATEEKKAEEIKQYEKRTGTTGFIIDIAHDLFGLVFPDEILFKEDN